MQGNQAIDTFFEGATDAEAWPGALETIARDLSADGATLMDGQTHRLRVAVSTHISGFVQEYFSLDVSQFDSREDRVQPTEADGFVGDYDSYTPEELDRDPYYTEFLRPRGFGWHAVACLRDGHRPLMLSLKRRFNQGPFQRAELSRISRVLPYLRAGAHAAQIALSLRFQDHLNSLQADGQGGLLLNHDGAVLGMNAAFAPGDGLAIVEGRLRAAYPAEQAALDRAVAIAISPAPPHELPPPTAVILHRPSGRRPLIVRVSRLFEAASNPVVDARALVSVVDTGLQRTPTGQLLRDLFGLTPKETELAVLLGSGHGLSEAAQLCRISLPHARQRLKIVFQKTETSRQSELVTLLLRLT
jgi:DNA-binding CsgD family transcriptional regulator